MSDDTQVRGGQPEDLPTLDAQTVVDAFGGIRPMAARMGIAVSTVQGWKGRNHIPDNRWRDVIAAAEASGLNLAALAVKPDVATDESEDADASDAEDVDASSTEVTEEDGYEAEEEAPEADDEATSDASSSEADVSDVDAQDEEVSEQAGAPEPVADSTTETQPVAQSEAAPIEKAPSAVAAAAKAPARSGGGRTAMLALFLAIVALLGVLTRPYWAPLAEPHIASVMARVAPNLVPSGPADGGAAIATTTAPTVDQAVVKEIAAKAQSLASQTEEIATRVAALESALTAIQSDPAAVGTGATPDVAQAADPEVLERLAALEDATERLAASSAAEANTATAVEVDPAVASAEQLADLANDLAALQGGVESLRAMAETATSAAQDLDSQVETLTSDVGDRNAAFEAALAEVRALAAEQPELGGAKEAVILLAASEISASVPTGRAYKGPLSRLSALMANAPADTPAAKALSVLRGYASTGVPTFGSLVRGFHRISAEVHGIAVAPEETDLLRESLARLSSLVSIRPTGDGADSPLVSQAEAALERGDLAGAIDVLSAFPSGKFRPLDEWMLSARARIAAIDAAAALEAAALDGFAGATGGDSSGGDS